MFYCYFDWFRLRDFFLPKSSWRHLFFGDFRTNVCPLLFQLKLEGMLVLSFRSVLPKNCFLISSGRKWCSHTLVNIFSHNKSVSVFLSFYVPVKSKLQQPPRVTPGHLNLWKIFVQIPPSRGRKAVQMPHHRSIPGDQMPPPSGNFSVAFITLRKLCYILGLIDNTLTCQR